MTLSRRLIEMLMRANGFAHCWPTQAFAVPGEASELPSEDTTITAAVA